MNSKKKEKENPEKFEKLAKLFFILLSISILTNSFFIVDSFDEGDYKVAGMYSRKGVEDPKMKIEINTETSVYNIKSTFYHELGHYIYDQKMTENEIAYWRNITEPINEPELDYHNDYSESFARWSELVYSTDYAFFTRQYKFIKRINIKYGVEILE